eukprot:11165210-Lingulodinium_polyedra.AAC.1
MLHLRVPLALVNVQYIAPLLLLGGVLAASSACVRSRLVAMRPSSRVSSIWGMHLHRSVGAWEG